MECCELQKQTWWFNFYIGNKHYQTGSMGLSLTNFISASLAENVFGVCWLLEEA